MSFDPLSYQLKPDMLVLIWVLGQATTFLRAPKTVPKLWRANSHVKKSLTKVSENKIVSSTKHQFLKQSTSIRIYLMDTHSGAACAPSHRSSYEGRNIVFFSIFVKRNPSRKKAKMDKNWTKMNAIKMYNMMLGWAPSHLVAKIEVSHWAWKIIFRRAQIISIVSLFH